MNFSYLSNVKLSCCAIIDKAFKESYTSAETFSSIILFNSSLKVPLKNLRPKYFFLRDILWGSQELVVYMFQTELTQNNNYI